MATIGRPGILDADARPPATGLASIAAGLVMAVGGVTLLVAGRGSLWGLLLLAAAPLFVVVPLVQGRDRAQERRVRRVLPGWAAARGLAYLDVVPIEPATPLLRLPASELRGAMRGPIGGDPDALLVHHLHVSRQGKAAFAQWSSLAIVRVEEAEGLALRIGRRLPSWGGGAWLAGWEALPPASLGLGDDWRVEARAGGDRTRVRAVLDRARIGGLLEVEPSPLVEVDDGVLVVAYSGRVGVDDGVDDLAWFERLQGLGEGWTRVVRDPTRRPPT